MKNVWRIFKQDLKNIQRVPFIGILLIGLAILPALYAWFNLGAAWDPYANTEGIKIAVVNEDEGTEVEDEYLNIGDLLAENLADNHELGWEFTSRQEAEDGVKNGDYYAGIYIEDTFSGDLARIIEGEPRKAEVVYQVNEKVNAIAPKMTSAGASAIVNQINEQFVEMTSSILFEEFDRLGIRLEEELPTMRRIKQVVYELDEHFPEINKFADNMIEVEENWGEIDSSIDQFLALEDYLPQIHHGAAFVLRLEEQFPFINQLGEEVLKLEQTIPEIEQAVEDLSGIDAHFSEMADHMEWMLENTQSAQRTINNIQDSIPSLMEKRETAEEYMETLYEFAREVEGSADSVNEVFLQQLYVINKAAAGIDQALAMIDDEETADETAQILGQLNEQLISSISVLENTINMYEMLYEATQDERMLPLVEQLTVMQNRLQSLQQEVEQLSGQLERGEQLNMEHLETVREKAQEVEASSNHAAGLLEGEWAENVKNAYTVLLNNVTESENDIEGAYAELEVIGGILDEAEHVTIAGEETIQNLLNALPSVKERVAELVQKTQEELPEVIDIIKSLSDFVRDDLPLIESRINDAAKMIREDLPDIEQRYVEIADVLEELVPEVKASLSELNDFSREYLPDLEDTIHRTADRIRIIEDEGRISELIAVLRNDLDEESEFFASPVDLKEESLFPIPNYGSANVPFYTVLSIWVGALLLTNLISTNVHSADMRKDYTLRQIYFGKMILFLIVGILQGIIVSTGNIQLLGIYSAHPFLLVLFSIIIAIIFMTIVYTLVSILGNIGKALAIVLLVLQLSSSGGTFPIDVAPPFFQAIHPFMPFSYAIDLLREAVGGVIPLLVMKNIAWLIIFWIAALIVGLLLKPVLTERIEKTYQKSKSSRLID